ncbi:MAG: tol-pal system YbgF family protein [Bacteroidales bacterium]
MKLINVFYLICIFLCGSFSLNAGISFEEDSLLLKAQELYEQGDYFEAGIAFERAYFFSSESKIRLEANLGRSRALKQNGEFLKARNDLQRSLHLRQFPGLHFSILYELAFCEYMAGNYSNSAGVLTQIKHYYPEEYDQNRVLRLDALTNVMSENFIEAQEKTLELITRIDTDTRITDSLIVRTMQLFCECAQPWERSVRTASRLSTFIPGAGQVYAGYPGKGLLNAGSQLVSLGLAAYMGYNNLFVSGFVIGLGMFQSFYFGGIRQAGYLAEQKNLEEMGAYKELLKDFIIGLDD